MSDTTPQEAQQHRTGKELTDDLDRLIAVQNPSIREQATVLATLDERIRAMYDEQRERRKRISEMELESRRLGAEAVAVTIAESRTQGVRVFSRVAHIVAATERLDADQAEEVDLIMEGLGRARPGARMLMVDRSAVNTKIVGTRLVSRTVEVGGNRVSVRITHTSGDDTETFLYHPSDAKHGGTERVLLAVGRHQVEAFVNQNWASASLGEAIGLVVALDQLGIDAKDVIGAEESAKLDAALLNYFASHKWERIDYEDALSALAALNSRTPRQLAYAVRSAIITGLAQPMHQVFGSGGQAARYKVAALLVAQGRLEPSRDAAMQPKVLAEVAKLEVRAEGVVAAKRLKELAAIEVDITSPTFKGALRIMEVLGTPEELRDAAKRMRDAGDADDLAMLLETRAAIIEHARAARPTGVGKVRYGQSTAVF